MRRLVIDLRANRVAWRIPPESVAAITRALGSGWEVEEVQAFTSSDGDGGAGTAAAQAAARGAEVYLGFGVPSGVVAAARDTLRWAHTGTAGVGASLPQLRGSNIIFTNSAGIHAEPIADWAIAAIAYFARGLDRMVLAQREHRWAKTDFTDAPEERELQGLRMGVYGIGGLGGAVARRGIALGMRVAGVRRRPERGGPPGVAWVRGPEATEQLAAASDVFVVAAPQTGSTKGAGNRDVLARLPRGAIVVNVSRGALLDETALLALLDEGHLRGVALDVFAVEPLPAEHPFWPHPRVLISPHSAAVSDRFWQRETDLIVENIRRYLAGTPLANVVDLEAGY